jgi:hypothetical protein
MASCYVNPGAAEAECRRQRDCPEIPSTRGETPAVLALTLLEQWRGCGGSRHVIAFGSEKPFKLTKPAGVSRVAITFPPVTLTSSLSSCS